VSALINYYFVDILFFCKKSGEILEDYSIGSYSKSVTNFPVAVVLIDERRDQLALCVNATMVLTLHWSQKDQNGP
jgi:hypothetical protein